MGRVSLAVLFVTVCLLSHKNLLLSSYSSAPMNADDNDSSSNLTPHELESSDEESDVDEEEELQQEGVLLFGETALNLWSTRSVKLYITGCARSQTACFIKHDC